jgi:hypothetical protein
MSSLVISGDTSGTVTVTVPAVAGTNTATLPAATGTVMVSGNMPAFSVYANASQSLTSNVFTKVALNTKNFDTASAFDSTTNYRFTPQVAGYYQINATVRFSASSAASQVIATLYKNGSEFFRGGDTPMSSANPVSVLSFSNVVFLNGSTDYVELYGYSYLGTSVLLNYSSAVVTSAMSGTLIRAS